MAARISVRAENRESNKGKVTCLTCRLKGCVGHCRFAVVAAPPARKAS